MYEEKYLLSATRTCPVNLLRIRFCSDPCGGLANPPPRSSTARISRSARRFQYATDARFGDWLVSAKKTPDEIPITLSSVVCSPPTIVIIAAVLP